MVFEVRERDGQGHGEIARVAGQLGVHREAQQSLPAIERGDWRRAEALARQAGIASGQDR
jgi:hypothetical protein